MTWFQNEARSASWYDSLNKTTPLPFEVLACASLTYKWKVSLNFGDQLLLLDLVECLRFLSARWGPIRWTSMNGRNMPFVLHFTSFAATTWIITNIDVKRDNLETVYTWHYHYKPLRRVKMPITTYEMKFDGCGWSRRLSIPTPSQVTIFSRFHAVFRNLNKILSWPILTLPPRILDVSLDGRITILCYILLCYVSIPSRNIFSCGSLANFL